MQRYNIFFPIHKGLRALLYETALLAQQTTFTDAGEAQEIIEKIKSVVQLFDEHAHTEDTHILPAIAAFEPSVVDAFEQEHHEDHALGRQLEILLAAFDTALHTSLKQKIGEDLVRAFVQFVAFNLKHMAKEEDIINNLLWRYYTDAELQAITQKIISSLAPQQMAATSKWMVRGMSNTEIAAWLKGVKNNAPESVWAFLLALAESELAPHRWNIVQDALTEGAMVA